MKRQDGADIEIARVALERCPGCGVGSTRGRRFYQHHGSYVTRWNGRSVPRYRCKDCGKTFSPQTFRTSYRQHRPDMNAPVLKLYNSGMTQRRMARVLALHRNTVVRKFLYLAELSREAHAEWLATVKLSQHVQFDEMETFEHTKLKPVSIALAVDAKTGAILAISAEPTHYKGKLASIAFQKYGPRVDRSGHAIAKVLEVVARKSTVKFTLTTDDSPKYPPRIRMLVPHAHHRRVKRVPPAVARRRRNTDDPLFALNVVAAKLRNDLSRLSRKTWVTTKSINRLNDHLALYFAWNNGYRLAA